MKARNTLLILILFAISACQNHNNSSSNSKSQASHDTFYLCDKLVEIDTIPVTTFTSAKDSFVYDTSEMVNLQRDSAFAWRTGDTLFLRVDGNKIASLTNDNSDGPDLTHFQYQGLNTELKQYIIYAGYWEGMAYWLVDQENGDTTVVCNEPVISPDKKTFICGNSDLIAEYTFNGFELYSNAHPAKLLCRRELKTWGPTAIKWIDDKTLYCSVDITDTDRLREITRYYKLTIK